MGVLLMWTGLTIIMTTQAFPIIPAGNIVGAVFMLIGIVVAWIGK